MKTLAVSMILALGLAAPAFAEPPAPAPATMETTSDAAPADADIIDEAAIFEATTPEAHAKLLLKCSGPPPRPPKVADIKPASEPASTTSSGG
jgi:hypothetical protein